MKKTRPIISILIAFMMVFSTFGFFSFPSSVYANENGEEIVVEENVESSVQELATPTNLIWKDESTATAAWDAVDGATSYQVYRKADGTRKSRFYESTYSSANKTYTGTMRVSTFQYKNAGTYQVNAYGYTQWGTKVLLNKTTFKILSIKYLL